MIRHPILIFIVLAGIEAFVLWVSGHARARKYFRFLPAVFWVYFLPMLASSAGWLDTQSPLYSLTVTYGLPASLFLLLLGVDLPAIARLGRVGILMFLSGSLGIMAGTVISFALFRPVVGDVFWSGFGALSASWTGGSANMIAVKEAAGVPDEVYLPMVVVDTLVPYVWMGLLVSVSAGQKMFDSFNRADPRLLEDIRRRVSGTVSSARAVCPRTKNIVLLGALASAVSGGLHYVTPMMPVVKGVVSPLTWTIILASLVGMAGSLTVLRRCESIGSTRVGYWVLYFVLTTVGAKADLSHLGTSLVLILAGFVIVLVHVIVLLIAARALKAPLMLAAAASQANVGGVASAPIVAEVYQPGSAAVGLLMAVLGNVIGTYLGIVTGQICRWVTLVFP
jgi:uncharacterized membrane protein